MKSGLVTRWRYSSGEVVEYSDPAPAIP